jgi:hypothetical protein
MDNKNKDIYKLCETCNQSIGLFKCGNCKNAYYCSRNCQQISWIYHKSICKSVIDLRKLCSDYFNLCVNGSAIPFIQTNLKCISKDDSFIYYHLKDLRKNTNSLWNECYNESWKKVGRNVFMSVHMINQCDLFSTLFLMILNKLKDDYKFIIDNQSITDISMGCAIIDPNIILSAKKWSDHLEGFSDIEYANNKHHVIILKKKNLELVYVDFTAAQYCIYPQIELPELIDYVKIDQLFLKDNEIKSTYFTLTDINSIDMWLGSNKIDSTINIERLEKLLKGCFNDVFKNLMKTIKQNS